MVRLKKRKKLGDCSLESESSNRNEWRKEETLAGRSFHEVGERHRGALSVMSVRFSASAFYALTHIARGWLILEMNLDQRSRNSVEVISAN